MSALILTLIVLGSVVAGGLTAVMMLLLWQRHQARTFRSTHRIPDILGVWKCRWFDDRSQDEPKVEDRIEIYHWGRDGEFDARGHQPQFSLMYPIRGAIDPSRVVIAEYKAEKYPYEPNHGVLCMELSRDGTTMKGQWFGRRFSGQLSGGRVEWRREGSQANVPVAS